MFSDPKGWKAFARNMEGFCKLMQFTPTHEQRNYLLRVQNAGKEGARIGMDLGAEEEFGVIVCATLYRALVHGTMSFMFYEHEDEATLWIQRMVKWVGSTCDTVIRQVEVSKKRRFLAANKVHICHLVGPWSNEKNFGTGLYDIVILNFDDMPSKRIQGLLDISKGSILYLPLQKK